MPDDVRGTSPYLSVLVLNPSLVKSMAVEGLCDLAVEGKVIRSPMFSTGTIGLTIPAVWELCIRETLLDI